MQAIVEHRTAFDTRIASLTAQINHEYALEYGKRLDHATALCKQLSDANAQLTYRVDLYKRQVSHCFKALEIIKRKSLNANDDVNKLQSQHENKLPTAVLGQDAATALQHLQSVIAFISDTAARMTATRPKAEGNRAEDAVALELTDVRDPALSLTHESESLLQTDETREADLDCVHEAAAAAERPHEERTHQATNSRIVGTIRSSQSTEDGESLEPTQIKEEPDCHSSSPTVTDVRTVRRERVPDRDADANKVHLQPPPRYNGTSQNPFHIKEEPESSPPEILASQSARLPTETLDLDEVNEHVHTPHKRRRLARQINARIPDGHSFRQVPHHGFERAQSMPSTVPQSTTWTDDLSPRRPDNSVVTRGSSGRQKPRAEAVSTTPLRKPALAAMSENEQNTRQLRFEQTSTAQKRRHAALAKGRALGEDDESLPLVSQMPTPTGTEKAPQRSIHGSKNSTGCHKRLEGLLSGVPVESPSLLISERRDRRESMNRSVASSFEETSEQQAKKRAEECFHATTRLSPSRAKEARDKIRRQRRAQANLPEISAESARTRSVSPTEEPLRARPLDKLKLTDFRINPEFNDGRNFAFAEVVRKQIDRRCLPGCTDLRCCGGRFRTMARMGISPKEAAGSRRSFMEATPSQEEPLPEGVADAAELGLLERYFGSGFQARQRLANMTAEARADAVLEARAVALADEHGRHRQRFERAASPDEFWDTDFPNTQKIQESRDRAHRSDREKVAARHREALKGRSGHGRFLFRDE